MLFITSLPISSPHTQALPPSLPTASTLFLHTIQALLCSGEYNQADERCSQLVETLLPSVDSMLAQHCKKEEEEEEGVRCMLVLSQAFCFRSSAAIELNQLTEAKNYCERYEHGSCCSLHGSCCSLLAHSSITLMIPWFTPEVFKASSVASVESRSPPGGHVTVHLEDTGAVICTLSCTSRPMCMCA